MIKHWAYKKVVRTIEQEILCDVLTSIGVEVPSTCKSSEELRGMIVDRVRLLEDRIRRRGPVKKGARIRAEKRWGLR